MELLSKRIRTLTIGLEGSVSNACRQFLLKRIFAMQFAELKLPSKDTPSQGIPTLISLPTLGLRISAQKTTNEKYDNCFSKTHRKEVMSKLFRNIM